MDFRGDERGQPVQIGFILLFGILVLAFAGYQGYVVPNQNAEIEFNHFQTVDDQFTEFQSNLVNAVGSETERATTFSLGVQYPSRLLALNPPPVSGQLRTTEPSNVSIVDGDGGQRVADVCGSIDATSRSLVYSPGYNEFDNAESMTYENGFVAQTYSEGAVFTDQKLVSNNSGSLDGEIDLTLLTGSVSENGQGSYSLEVNATHRYSTTVTDPTITLPSQFDGNAWENDTLGDYNVDATDTGSGRVELDFTGEYKISCAVVGLDGAPKFEPPTPASLNGNESDFGHGGTEEWNAQDATRTVSTQGGLWRNVGTVNSLVLSNPRLSPIEPEEDQVYSYNRFFRLAVTVGDSPDSGRRYVFVVPASRGGMVFEHQGGSMEWQANDEVLLLSEDSNGLHQVFRADLETDLIDDWYQNGGELNLLSPAVYENSESVRTDLSTVRDYLQNNGGQEAFVTDITGRVDLTIEDRDLGAGGAQISVVTLNDNSNWRGARYQLQVQVAQSGSFDSIEVTFQGEDDTETMSVTNQRQNYNFNYQGGWGTGYDDYDIVIELYDDSGVITDSRTINDNADGSNP